MFTGTKVFFLWHDYISGRDLHLQGEVVDNSLWQDHRACASLVNVRFMMPGVKAAVCHHFKPEELHIKQDTLPSPAPKLDAKPQQAPKQKKQSTVQYVQLALF